MAFESLIKQFRQLEHDLDHAIDEQKLRFHFTITNRRVRFEQAVRERHRQLRRGLVRYLVESGFLALLFAPIVYSLIIPLTLLDLFVTIYQITCFPIYGIKKVKRADYIVIDRQHLQYLNLIEKMNCAYCGYANGLLAYARAIAGRSEEHWCPIKHARRTKGQHQGYWEFSGYGDADAFASASAKKASKPPTEPEGGGNQ